MTLHYNSKQRPLQVRTDRVELMAASWDKSAMLGVGLVVLVILRMTFSLETVTEEMAFHSKIIFGKSHYEGGKSRRCEIYFSYDGVF
jgi:hypothetical protein